MDESSGVDACPCGVPHPAEYVGCVEAGGCSVGVEEFAVIGPKPVVAMVRDLSLLSGELRGGPCQTKNTALREVAFDALVLGDSPDFIDGAHDLSGESGAAIGTAGSALRKHHRCAETAGDLANTPSTVQP